MSYEKDSPTICSNCQNGDHSYHTDDGFCTRDNIFNSDCRCDYREDNSTTTDDNADDICGFCGKAGADKIPHPIRWPGEESAGTKLVHTDCEDAECRRAHALLNDKERADFLRTL